ncbi:MAG: serine/threonine-protein kinase [Polyangiaceae bacterium]
MLEVLASGGMATVYLARQRGKAGFARTVAVKRMHPHFATETEFRALFIDEARLAARIVHPNVVQTLDVIEDDNELFIVMEYVRGLPLAQIQKLAGADGVPIDVACHVMVGALQGLQAAHQAKDEAGRPLQIVHRDVSPQNILIGSDGVARLIDFGVAKAVSQLHTTRGRDPRKLAMAPEQVKGGVVDPQTDVFSAAVVLWQLLAGKRLFVGANDGELIYRVLEHRIAPPSEFRRRCRGSWIRSSSPGSLRSSAALQNRARLSARPRALGAGHEPARGGGLGGRRRPQSSATAAALRLWSRRRCTTTPTRRAISPRLLE